MLFEKPSYTVREETVDGVTRYYSAFEDDSGQRQEIEVSYEVYLAIDNYRREEIRQVNVIKRHRERFVPSENQLAARALSPSLPMEDAVQQTVDMQAALATLTETQRRRFLLYHEHSLSYEQIATVEGCTHPAVIKAVFTAQLKLKKYFSKEGYKTEG